MYNLDLTKVAPSPVYPLDERFRGKDPHGHEIGFTNAYMTIDGKPFFGISGEMHHERMSPDQWEDSVIKIMNGGINIISVYVFWIVHEEEEGIFRFDGQRDIRSFLEICEKHSMMVIMRVGPFNHGEMRNGGLPDWLYGKPYEVRKDNPGFLAVVRRYFRELHKQMDGHYYSQGGCIVGTQIENEYQHSCAPWEITTGISNEWITLGGSGEKYMLALKKIMVEEGIITPFYTTTAWGGAVTPVEEALPLWGGYSYQPWLFYEKDGVHPATPEYIYRDNHNSAVTKEYNFEPSYDPGTRPYACCEMMGGMMCSYRYRFQLDMRAVDALANTKLGSGCNLLGYYVYKGGTNPLGKRTPFLNEGQITKRSYDYQAAVGEFGQIRESYGRLRAIHLFCNTFSGSFEDMKAVLPEHLKGLEPEDLGPLRFSVRIKDSSGFLFINNFQDHIEMKDRRGDEVVLSLPDGDIVFRFDIAAGENAILPFNMDLGGLKLDWATAQPMAKVGDTWFFLAPDGMSPKYSICRRVIEAEAGKSFTVGHITVMTLSRKDSLGFNVIDICGTKAAVLCDKPLLWDGNRMAVEFEEGDAELYMYPSGLLKKPEDAELLGKDLFEGFRIKSGKKIYPAVFHSTGYGRYVVDLPEKGLLGHKQVMLRVGYVGDIASAFINGEMISDNFSNGGKWDIRVDNEAERLKDDPLTIYITPKKENVVVDTSAMAGLQERVGSMTAELLSAEWVEVDEVTVM